MLTIFHDQIDYNRWANLRLFDATYELDEMNFKKSIVTSFPSIQQTWLHIIWAEELWLERWQGRPFVREIDMKNYPVLDHEVIFLKKGEIK